MSSVSSYVPQINPGGLIVTGSGALAIGNNIVADFWNQYSSVSGTGSVASWIGKGYLGVAVGSCGICDVCLCPQCEACLGGTAPAYVTAALSGWVSNLQDVQVIGDPNQTWNLGILTSQNLLNAGISGEINDGVFGAAQNGGQACTFQRVWQCNKPFTVRINPGLNASNGSSNGGTDEWFDLFTTNDGTTLALTVTYGGFYASIPVLVDEVGDIGDQTTVLVPQLIPGPVVSVMWTWEGIILGQGLVNLGTLSVADLINQYIAVTQGNPPSGYGQASGCGRCSIALCTDAQNPLGRIDCSQTYTLTDSGVNFTIGPNPEIAVGGEEVPYAGIFTSDATVVTGLLTFPTVWFPLIDGCPTSVSAVFPSITSIYEWSSSSGASQSTSFIESTIIAPGGGGGPGVGGPGTGGPGPGPGLGSSSGASSGAPSSLTTVSCTDNTTPGPLVPFNGGPGPGKFFRWTDNNCYRVQYTTSQSAPTYAPTEVFDTCEACTDADQYIQLTPCVCGSLNLYCYVPAWIASGLSVYPAPDGNCYQINAGNTRINFEELVLAIANDGAQIISAPTLAACTAPQCVVNLSGPYTATSTAVTNCPGCTVGTSTVTVSGSGSAGVYTAGTRDPSLTCSVDGLGYAWQLKAIVSCSSGAWVAALSLYDGCRGEVFSGTGVGTLSVVGGVITGTVTASGTDVSGNHASITFTFA